jgi:hypothetical protein
MLLFALFAEFKHITKNLPGFSNDLTYGKAPGLNLARVEEIGLNALQTQRQLFYDGWLLRVSPGKAKRARSWLASYLVGEPGGRAGRLSDEKEELRRRERWGSLAD